MADFLGQFREILARAEDLPTLPQLVFELHSALDREEVRVDEVALIIERDPALATRLLRVANSAAFSLGSEIDSIGRAIERLGVNQVRTLSIALAVVNAFSGRRGGLSLRSFWEHSAAVALVARHLALNLRANNVTPDQAYLGGLLHDVGLLLLDQFFPEWLQKSLADAYTGSRPLFTSEDTLFGVDHGEIGGFLLGRWGLPAQVVQMVASHHSAAASPAAHRNACWTVYAAELICSGHGPVLSVEGLDADRSSRIVQALHAVGYDVDRFIDRLATDAGEFADIVHP